MRLLLGAGLAVLSMGCALGPDYERPPLEVPAGYVEPAPSGESIVNLPWWEIYRDDILVELIRTALAENKDLEQAYARVEEARARLTFVRADLFPQIDVFGNGFKQEFESDRRSARSIEGYRFEAGAFYELDLWGKLRRSTEAARGDLLATEEGYRAFTIGLVADVASAYFLLCDFDERLRISAETVESRKKSTGIIRARYEKGYVSALDVHQAEIEEAEAAAAVEFFKRQIALTEHGLSVLLGRNPGGIRRGQELFSQQLPPAVPAGLPSELLEQRPDVLSAEQSLAAQTARIGVAQALRLPSLSLTGSFGYQSDDLSDWNLGKFRFWSLGGDLFGPILSANRNVSRVWVAEAQTRQLALAYEQSVLRAFQEVEDALVSIRTFHQEFSIRKGQVDSARKASRLSRARYDGGQTSYLEVLDIERSLFNAELAASEALRQELVSIVQLYRALGGGWNPESPDSVAAP